MRTTPQENGGQRRITYSLPECGEEAFLGTRRPGSNFIAICNWQISSMLSTFCGMVLDSTKLGGLLGDEDAPGTTIRSEAFIFRFRIRWSSSFKIFFQSNLRLRNLVAEQLIVNVMRLIKRARFRAEKRVTEVMLTIS